VKLCDMQKGIAAMQVRVDYDRAVGHPDAEKHAAEVAALRAKLPK
jgi:hypothetical protein